LRTATCQVTGFPVYAWSAGSRYPCPPMTGPLLKSSLGLEATTVAFSQMWCVSLPRVPRTLTQPMVLSGVSSAHSTYTRDLPGLPVAGVTASGVMVAVKNGDSGATVSLTSPDCSPMLRVSSGMKVFVFPPAGERYCSGNMLKKSNVAPPVTVAARAPVAGPPEPGAVPKHRIAVTDAATSTRPVRFHLLFEDLINPAPHLVGVRHRLPLRLPLLSRPGKNRRWCRALLSFCYLAFNASLISPFCLAM
jgi:hypothetical protein